MNESGSKNLVWNEYTVYALGLYRIICYSLGIWPFNCYRLGPKIVLLVTMVMQLIMNYNLIQELLAGCATVTEILNFIGILASSIVCILKVSVIRFHREKMYRILRSAVKDWSCVRDEKSHEIMRNHAYVGKCTSIFQLSVGYITIGVIILSTQPTIDQATSQSSNTSNLTIAPVRNIFSSSQCSVVDMPSAVYLAFYYFQFIQILSLCTCSLGSDSIFLGIAMHLCGQLQLLKTDIARLGEDHDEEKARKELIALINRHRHLDKHANLVETIFQFAILGQLAASTLRICLLGIQMLIALQLKDYTTFMCLPIWIFILLLQLYTYYYVGEKLASQIKEIRDAAYNCSWYNFSPGLTKDVMFVITRCNGSFKLTAGKFYRMDRESFTSFIKVMASFFSVVKLHVIK